MIDSPNADPVPPADPEAAGLVDEYRIRVRPICFLRWTLGWRADVDYVAAWDEYGDQPMFRVRRRTRESAQYAALLTVWGQCGEPGVDADAVVHLGPDALDPGTVDLTLRAYAGSEQAAIALGWQS